MGLIELPFRSHPHVYYTSKHIIHAYIYMSIRANHVPTQGSAETVLLRSNSKITLLTTRTSPVLPLGTHFFVALALLIWWAWPTKVDALPEDVTNFIAPIWSPIGVYLKITIIIILIIFVGEKCSRDGNVKK